MRAALLFTLAFTLPLAAQPKLEPPVCSDPRIVVELFAASPDIVQPIATDFDSKGRLLVVESHTHFRPANYKGPKFDRIRMLEDTDGKGKANKITTFYEGTTHTMDLAVHPDGSVYLATRNEIIRLRDTKGTGQADERTRIAFLDTTGNYPHNGLSGISFDAKGDLFFGMGENLGAPYKLIGADGTVYKDTEGGKIFTITADGKKLRKVATGFWNPFGSCRDIFGRLFVVDNDPDDSPPCRLVHVVEGGDYGFQFRYGRQGRHVFQAWNGELPGTLPYVCGTGESPTEVISYESDGLPKEYLGNLLVPAWADHRVERYILEPKGASFTSIRKPFIQGGKDFYPAGMTVAPDGSLFVTDWGSRSYELHGKGAVWHVRMKDGPPARAKNPGGIASGHRPTREAAARKLAEDEKGRETLRNALTSSNVRTRAAALNALIAVGDTDVDLRKTVSSDDEAGMQELAVRGLIARKADVSDFTWPRHPAGVRAEAMAGSKGPKADYVPGLDDPDPFIRHAAILRFARISPELLKISPELLLMIRVSPTVKPKQRLGMLLASREVNKDDSETASSYLDDPDPDVRFLAIKWVSDEKLMKARPQIEKMMAKPGVDAREFVGLATTLARLDDRPVDDNSLADYFLQRLNDAKAPASARALALRSIPARFAKLKSEVLTKLLTEDDAGLRLEALRMLTERADAKTGTAIRAIAGDAKQPLGLRAQALVALSANSANTDLLVEFMNGNNAALASEALRSLTQAKLPEDERAKLVLGNRKGEDRNLVARLLGQPFFEKRPPATDTEAWLKRLDGPADAEAGRRIFEHPRVASCAKCHRVDGRGANIGPDLSLIGRTDKKWIVESILQPSAVVAPNFQAWKVDTLDGKSRTGLLVGTYLDESVYIDAKGDRFKVLATEVADVTPAKQSIMPDGLADTLTDQELRDLVAYLLSRK